MPNPEPDNVERARAMMEVWSQGIDSVLARFDEFCTDDFEWLPPVAQLTGTEYVGREGFERYVADVREYLGDVRIELIGDPEEIAPDVVRMTVRSHGEGARSGAVIDETLTSICRYRDGRVCWGWGTYDPEVANKVAEELIAASA